MAVSDAISTNQGSPKAMSSLRVCLIGAFAPNYPRNQIIRVGLERVGFQVNSAFIPANKGTLRKLPYLLTARKQIRNCDVVLIPAFNGLLAPFIWALTRIWRKPTFLDYMVGLTDAISDERNEGSRLQRRIFRLVDKFNISHLSTFTDTMAHTDWFVDTLHIKPREMNVLPVGVYDAWYHEIPALPASRSSLILFFGNYLPFHGVQTIVEAAARLSARADLRFELIGRGKGYYEECVQKAQSLKLNNLMFTDQVSPELLPERVASATLCLGVFGARAKTNYVVPNKVFQCMAIGRPVITAESPALREFFTPGKHLITVPPENPEALAGAIQQLIDAPNDCVRMGQAAAARIREAFLPEHIGARLKAMIV